MVATTETDAPESSPEPVPGVNDVGIGRGMHFPALDGARAVAAIGVFITHLGLLSGFITSHNTIGPYMARMDVGVAVFFVLSGFLLYRPFVAARFNSSEPRPTGSYALRRLLRIFPAYWVALLLIAFVFRAPAFEDSHSFVAHLLLIHAYDGSQVTGGPIQQSWTLVIELAFYAFVPVWAWLMSRRDREPSHQFRFELISLAMLMAVSGAANVALLFLGVDGSRFSELGIWLPFRITDFIPGMALAVISAWVSHRSISLPRWITSHATSIVSWGLALVVFWVLSTQLGLPAFPTYSAKQAFAVRVLYLAFAVFFITPAILGRREGGPVNALLANRVAIWLGLVSYGVYIWHEAWQILYQRWFNEPFLQSNFIRMGIFSGAMTLATAAISWYLIERPVMRWGSRRTS